MALKKTRTKLTNSVLMWSTQLWTGAAALIGILTIIGGEARWSAQVYEYLALVPGSPEIWGVLLILLAGLIIFAWLRDAPTAMQIGLHGLGGWCVAFAVGLLFAAFSIPTVTLTAAVWLCVSAVQYFMLAKLWREYPTQGVQP